MKKLLLILLCAPLIFSCEDKDKGKKITAREAEDIMKDIMSRSKVITDEMIDNRYTGKGTYTLANGRKYKGEWKDGFFHGHGTLTFENGMSYNGTFNNGEEYGKGTFTYSDGSVKRGLWKDGEFIEE